MLDELERLHKAATPGPMQVEWDDDAPGGGSWIVIPTRSNRQHPLAWTGAGIAGRADADAVNAAMNTLPALLRVARAADAMLDLWDSRGSEEMRELQAALAALTTTTAPPASE
jgi:hypothetical protein